MEDSVEKDKSVSITSVMQNKWKKHRAKLVISLVANHTKLARVSHLFIYILRGR